MADNRKIVGLWQGQSEGQVQSEAADASSPEVLDTTSVDAAIERPPPDSFELPVGNDWEHHRWPVDEAPRRRRDPWLAVALSVLAIGWIAVAGWAAWSRGFDLASADAWLGLITTLSGPLILLAAVYLIVQRNSTTEAEGYGALMAELEQRTDTLQSKLAGVNAYLAAAHRELHAEGERLSTLSLEVGGKVQQSGAMLRTDMAESLASSDAMADRATRAAQQVEGLLAALPRVDAVAARLTENLRQAGLIAHKHGSALEVQIASLRELSDSSSEAIGGAAEALDQRMLSLRDQGGDVVRVLEDAREGLLATLSGALSRCDAAITAAREAAGSHAEALAVQAESARDRVDQAGVAMLEQTLANLAHSEARLAAMGATIEDHTLRAGELTATLATGLETSEQKMGALDGVWAEKLNRLSTEIAALSEQAEGMTARLGAGGDTAGTLVHTTETLMIALDSVARELDESLPRAFARFDERAAQSRRLVDEIEPGIERVESAGRAALGHFTETSELLSAQAEAHSAQIESAAALAEAHRRSLEDIRTIVAEVEREVDGVSTGSTPRLVEALVRVRETAAQAVEHARGAMDGAVDDVTARMRRATTVSLVNAMEDGIGDAIAGLSEVSEGAVGAARAAADTLMRQLQAIADTSAAIEARADYVRSADAERENLTRHVALLTESLKSTAIDVTKILSNEVTDTAWEAYLKGDRGVFARRAVKLVDSADAKEILGHYERDQDFRGYVNRYIHDFEAMLRNLLAMRDGQALSVTLLSSDMGKLYVALAQAIERLRG